MEPDPRDSASRRMEAYLDQILAPLARRLSPFHQDELRRELRAHLWERVDAYHELGQPEDEAVTEALRQFGGAEDFLRQWRREWKTTPLRVTPHEVWEAARPALRPTAAGIVVAFLPATVIHISYCNLQGSPAGAFLYSHGGTIFQAWFSFAYLLMPAVVGIRHGRRTPECGGVGILTALMAEIVTASLLYEIVGWALPYSDWRSSVGFFVECDGGILLRIMAVWIPVASAAAAASGWWRRRLQARRLA